MPTWKGWAGKGVYLPFLLPFASQDGSHCLCIGIKAQGFVEYVCCVDEACCNSSFSSSSIGEVQYACCTIKAFLKRPSTP
jgi:hypothetical protein